MPVIKDQRIIEANKAIRGLLRKDFEFHINDGRTPDWVIDFLIKKYGWSESKIMQTVKRQGKYAD